MRATALILTAALALPLSGRMRAAPPQNPPAFQLRSDAVRLDVRVVDADGHVVRDLTRDDFHVVDEGVAQQISQFELVDRPRPAPAAARSDLKADAATNRAFSDGRAYMILFDDLHISPRRRQTAQAIARQFIEHHVERGDRVAISTTSGTRWVSHEFTDDCASLLDAVDRLSFVELYGRNELALRSMRAVVDYLATIPDRRKSILFISEGVTLAVGVEDFANNTTGALLHEARDLLTASAKANVSFYPVDPRGDPGVPSMTIMPAPAERERLSAHQINARSGLTRLATETGGSALIGSNRFTDAFQRLVEDNSTYYLLGYTVADGTPRSRHHRVRVTVDREGVIVQSQHGYSGDVKPPKRGKVPRTIGKDLGDVLRSPLPLTGLRMDMTVAAFRGAGSKASVGIVLEVAGDAAGEIDAVVTATHEEATTGFGQYKQATLHLEPSVETATPMARFATDLELKPGRYHLRAAAIRHDKGASGSVLFDVEVPNFRDAALILSSLRISTDTRGATARRVFRPEESLVIDAEVYSESSAAQPFTVHGFISSAEGGIVRRHDAQGVMPAGRERVFRFGVPLPLSELAPGFYVVDVEVRAAGKNEVVLRRVPIAIQ